VVVAAIVAGTRAELEFAVHVKEGGAAAADRVAAKHGMANMGEVIPESGYYLLRTVANSRRRRSVGHLTHLFTHDTEVDWSEFQAPLERVKRVPLSSADNPARRSGAFSSESSEKDRRSQESMEKERRSKESSEKERRSPESSDSYNSYKFGRRLVDNLLPRKVGTGTCLVLCMFSILPQHCGDHF